MLFPVIRESEISPQSQLAMQLVEKFQQIFQKERQKKPQGHYWSPEGLFVCYFVDPPGADTLFEKEGQQNKGLWH